MQKTFDALLWLLCVMLVVVCLQDFLPVIPVLRLAPLPLVVAYHWSARAPITAWVVTFVGGMVIEAFHYLPPFSLLSILLLAHLANAQISKQTSVAQSPLTGMAIGLILLPILVVWLRLWTMIADYPVLFTPLTPALYWAPLIGALCGVIIFAVIGQLDFIYLKRQEKDDD